ncbi:MAG: response regulator transcription factor [Actinobacteria bacterium]|nr:response regulator transcription factor [Actinomycetota bacterium]
MMTGTEPRTRPTTDRIRVLVVDDGADVRFLVRRLLARERTFQVVGEATDGEEAIDAATELQPQIVLLDLSMPRMRGDEALPAIVTAAPDSMIAVFSTSITDERCRELQDLGAFDCYDKLEMPRLPELLERDWQRFSSR